MRRSCDARARAGRGMAFAYTTAQTRRIERQSEEAIMDVNKDQLAELLLQMLETEQGGVKVYETALRCVRNDELKGEWEKYRSETTQHVEIVTGLIEHFAGDPGAESPGRRIVRHIGQSLVKAMELALKAGGPPEAAQLVAAECVVQAETKDHLNWELLGEAARGLTGADAKAVKDALKEVEEQEDEHLYHSTGWCRELWIESLGLPAVLPPPEEEKDVKTAIGAARAKKARREML
jgi:rubrerythrin